MTRATPHSAKEIGQRQQLLQELPNFPNGMIPESELRDCELNIALGLRKSSASFRRLIFELRSCTTTYKLLRLMDTQEKPARIAAAREKYLKGLRALLASLESFATIEAETPTSISGGAVITAIFRQMQELRDRIGIVEAALFNEKNEIVPHRTNEETVRRISVAREIQILGAKYNKDLLLGNKMEQFLSIVFEVYNINFPKKNKSPDQFHAMMLTTAEIHSLLKQKYQGSSIAVTGEQSPSDRNWAHLQDKAF